MVHIVCGSMVIYLEATLDTKGALLNASNLVPFITSMLCLTLAMNVLTTGQHQPSSFDSIKRSLNFLRSHRASDSRNSAQLEGQEHLRPGQPSDQGRSCSHRVWPLLHHHCLCAIRRLPLRKQLSVCRVKRSCPDYRKSLVIFQPIAIRKLTET